MISVITYGRNDNYSFNLAKRVALGFNCLAEVLTEKDEIVFVDYNTPEPLPSLPEFIWDTFTPKARSLIKVVVVPPAVHNRIRRDSPLPLLENVSRNAGIVRSNPDNHWILCTNPDVVLIWPGGGRTCRRFSKPFAIVSMRCPDSISPKVFGPRSPATTRKPT